MEQRILVDYFVASFKKTHDERFDIFRELNKPLPEWENINSYYMCDICYYYEGLKIHISEDKVILDCSGKGCRTLENFFNWDWEEHFKTWKEDIFKRKIHIARLDIACDLLNSENITMSKLFNSITKKRYTCKSYYYDLVKGTSGETIYLGSPRSERRLRIYDKAKEQGRDDIKWIRFEFQLRNDNAISFILNYYNENHIGNTYYGIMHDYINFTVPP